ncbi:PDZ superfamily [Arabidopsis thaliana x Arabidopsis arenosa]|uniref:PDZ superfamily n=1 Tax=Arabidopsis thaliana x Arabidopsis arenosa TaxID=1240361 RepID=A0A8T2GQ64_9BRAS|nr:PDZ superfamily [Arabidopsis thaliana x Arabidopsis arenosa]
MEWLRLMQGRYVLYTRSMKNAMMRKYVKKIMTGVVVTEVNQHALGNQFVKKNDVILEIDGMTVEDDGKVFYENRLWMHLNGFIALNM